MAQDCKLLRSDGDISDHQWSQLPLCWFLLFTVPIIQKIPIQDKAGLPYCRTRTRVCHKRKNSQARVCHHQQRAGEVEEPQKHALNSETFLSLVNLAGGFLSILKNMSSSMGRINYPIYEMENHHKQSSHVPNHQFLDAYSPKYGDSGFDYPSSHDAPCRVLESSWTFPRRQVTQPSAVNLSRWVGTFPGFVLAAVTTVTIHSWLVVAWPLWKIWKSVLLIIPKIWKKKPCSKHFQTTNQQCLITPEPANSFPNLRSGPANPTPRTLPARNLMTLMTQNQNLKIIEKQKKTRPIWGITMMEPFLLHQTEDINRKRHHIKIPLKNCMFQCQWHCFVWTNSFQDSDQFSVEHDVFEFWEVQNGYKIGPPSELSIARCTLSKVSYGRSRDAVLFDLN